MPALPKVLIASNLIDRFKILDDNASGNLFGLYHQGTLVVLGLCVLPKEADSLDILNSIPSGTSFCGAFSATPQSEQIQGIEMQLLDDEDVDFSLLLSDVKGPAIQSNILRKGALTKVSFSLISNTELASTIAYFHLNAECVLNCEATLQGFKHLFEDIEKKVLDDGVAFSLSSGDIFISGTKTDKITGSSGLAAENRVKELLDLIHDHRIRNFDVLPTQVHLKLTKSSNTTESAPPVPLIQHIRRLESFDSATLSVNIDVLALVHQNSRIGTLYEVFKKSLERGFRLIGTNLVHQVKSKNIHSISIPEIHHFFPVQSNHFISVAYPRSSPDKELRNIRETLHYIFGFAVDQPLFRRTQAFNFTNGSNNELLTNPHEGLKSGVNGGEAFLVKGLYKYHHYMQDRFDDNGWGCAYRSLQTIVSWFRMQGYTEIPVPTHKQIQECLFKIGDKPSSFIGSRQWIGSTEVSFVLESMIGASCKILTASTGEEVGSLGSELSYHFQTHGTPIMIGGGVLAHTIIGVDYNRSTGEIKFLILDPHYTGSEDLNVITGKGWVGWKDVRFWNKTAFYNLCLPLRPIGDI